MVSGITERPLPDGPAFRRQAASAVVITENGSALQEQPIRMPARDEVLIRVHALGLCRTDLRVLSGQIPIQAPLIPGHEFAGVALAVGVDVTHVKANDRVVVDPVIACGDCEFCRDSPQLCQQSKFLGVDVDGACSELATIAARQVHVISHAVPFEQAAFAEPVAASLGVLNANIKPLQKGVVLGSNRIATLTCRILEAYGFGSVTRCCENEFARLPSNAFDFAIETQATTDTLRHLIRSLKPQGTLVLKSRQYSPVELIIAELLPKQLRIECVNYGSFSQAIELISSGRVRISDLVGEQYLLEDYQSAFANAAHSELVKTFIAPQSPSVIPDHIK